MSQLTRLATIAFLAPTLLLGLVGCGQAESQPPAETTLGAESNGPGPDGANTPQDLVDRMAGLTKTNRVSHILPLVLPEHRGVAAYVFGYLLPSTMIATQEMMGGFAAKASPESAKAFHSELSELKSAWLAVLTKHKVAVPNDHNPMEEVMALQRDASMKDNAIVKFNAAMKGVDRAAFIDDAMAFAKTIGKQSDKRKSGFSFNANGATIAVDGDRAIATQKNGSKPTKLTRHDGRWYIDMDAMLSGG